MQTSSKSLNWNLNNQVDMKFCNLMLNIQYLKISISVCFLTMSYCQFWSTNPQYVNNLFNTKKRDCQCNLRACEYHFHISFFFLRWVVSTLQWNQFLLFIYIFCFIPRTTQSLLLLFLSMRWCSLLDFHVSGLNLHNWIIVGIIFVLKMLSFVSYQRPTCM